MKNIDDVTDDDIDAILVRLRDHAKPLVSEVHSRAADGRLRGTDAWYQSSYMVFASGPRKEFKDFVRVVGYAYSWLSGIPKGMVTQEGFETFKKTVVRVKQVDKRRDESRRALVTATQSAMGLRPGSYISVSKVLHFWDPSLAPMYDKWVRQALESVGVTTPSQGEEEQDFEFYIKYWCLADRVIARSRMSKILSVGNYRCLDELLFQLGKSGLERTTAKTRKTVRQAGRAQRSSSMVGAKVVKQTKIALARQIVHELKGKPPQLIKRALAERAGLTLHGANTYYYRLVHEPETGG